MRNQWRPLQARVISFIVHRSPDTTGLHMFATPDEAENAFYTAFANGDLDAMMAVWLEGEAVTCIHPVGPRITGYKAVRASWAEILGSNPGLRFRLADVVRTQDALLAIHVLHELITVPGESAERSPTVATNIYQLTRQGWRMILHHASPVAVIEAHHDRPANRLH
jgi:ketosteroid isomerase-like protein